MEFIRILQYILAVALTGAVVLGLGKLKRALLRRSARLSRKALRRRETQSENTG
ncbi:MAG: hypothetical protein J6L24_00150 [Oscillospiraceae bacterium]|nr:hypothetical protein [Oscillospiraceae bacterium]